MRSGGDADPLHGTDIACAEGILRAVIWGLLIWAAGAWALCLVLS